MKSKILLGLLVISSMLIGNYSFRSQEFMPKDGTPRFTKDWKRIDSLENIGMYKSALQIVDSLYQIAFTENYSEQIIKTYIYKLKFLNVLEENAFERLLYQLRDEIPKQKPAEKAIMNSMLAEMYWMYYQNNRYKFLDRTNVSVFDENDIETWTLDNLVNHATKHYLASVKESDAIKNIPIEAYSELTYAGSTDKPLRPTLYDFIINRAILFFSQPEISSSRPLDYFELNNKDYYDPASDFVQIQTNTIDTNSLHFNALNMYQQWLNFRLKDSKNQSALLMADLQRLQFVHSESVLAEKDSLYYAILKKMENRYKKNKFSGEIYFLEASYLLALKNSAGLLEAQDICDNIIKDYPKSAAAQKAKSILAQINKKQLSFFLDENNSSSKPFLVNISYRNIKNMYYRIGKMNYNEYSKLAEDYYGAELVDKINAKVRFSDTKKIELPNSADKVSHKSQFIMDKQDPGEYIVMVSDNPDFSAQKDISTLKLINITDLSYLNTSLKNGDNEFYVFNRNTGKPIQGVKCQTYHRYYPKKSWRFSWKKDKLYTTDADGKFSIKALPNKDNQTYKVDFVYAQNQLSTNRNFSIKEERESNGNEIATHFFTDRAIYRPGQTIHFKGIVISTRGKETQLLKNHKSTVYLYDPNWQLVKELNITTNEFGSFSGSINIPLGNLNGQYNLKTNHGNKYIKVEEYKRPKFEVKLDEFKGDYLLNQQVEVSGNAKTYFGVNLNDAKVKYRIKREPAFSYWWWHYRSPSVEIANGIATTDNSGNFKIQFTAKPDLKSGTDPAVSFRYNIQIDVTDLDGETRSTSGAIIVGYSALKLSANIDDKTLLSDVSELKINAFNLNGQKQKASGNIQIFKLKEKNKVWLKNPQQSDTMFYTQEQWKKQLPNIAFDDSNNLNKLPKGKKVLEKAFDTENTINLKSSISEIGRYVLEMQSTDKFGNKVSQTQYFTVYNTQKLLPYPTPIWFETIKTTCKPGETAQILIGTGFKDVKVLYQLEKRDNQIEKKWLDLSNEQKLIEIPVTEDQRGNFKVSFFFIKHNHAFQQEATITVPYDNKQLDITFETFRDKLQPGEKETWKLKIQGKDKDKAMAEMVATLYDASLDQFAKNQWLFNYLQYFRSQHQLYTNCFGSANSQVFNNANTWLSFPSISYRSFNWFGFSYSQYNSFLYSEAEYDMMDLDEVVVASSPKKQRNRGNIGMKMMEESTIEDEVEVEMEESFEEEQKNQTNDKNAENKTTTQEIKVRTNLNETVFFYPHLKTDQEGNLVIEFTMNEALTKWKMMGFAHTKDLEYGFVENELITQKDLMVVPNPPRFFREGDKMFFSAKVSNITDKKLAGKTKLEFFDALTMKPLAIISQNEIDFDVEPQQSALVEWPMEIPDGVSAIMYKITAKSGSFTDGQQAVIPVMTNRMLVTETMPLYVRGNEKREFTFESLKKKSKSKTLKHHKLTLEFTSNPAWYAIQALPYLMEYPYECNEQTFSRYYANSLASFVVNSSPKIKTVFDQWKNVDKDALVSNLEKNQELKSILLQETPWVLNAQDETVRKQNVALLFDLNKMSNELSSAINKLDKEQYNSGAWPWFSGMPESRYVTQHIAKGFGQLKNLKVIDIQDNNQLKRIIPEAISYLDKEMNREYSDLKKYYKKTPKELEKDHLSYMALHYLYMRSFYPEYNLNNKYQEAFDYFFGQAQKYWMNRDIYSQGIIALVLNRKGNTQLPKTIVKSLAERSIKHEEMGMYWKENIAGWYWYQAPISTQALMIEVFDEIANDQNAVSDLRLWLLKQKQTQDWSTTVATVDAVYALLLRGSDWLANTGLVNIQVGGKKIDPTKEADKKPESGTGYFKISWDKDQITKEMAKVKLDNPNEVPAWGGMYWQYFEQLDKITSHETNLNIKKDLFKETFTNKGPVLLPINKKSELNIGDRVIVRVEIRVDRDMEYVHLKDMRAAGFEPENVISRYKYQDGLGYYESTKDASTNFFIGYLPKGTYVFEYPLRATLKGNFSNGITTIQCMYAPEFASHSQGIRVDIK